MYDIFALECLGHYGYGTGFFFEDDRKELRRRMDALPRATLDAISVVSCCSTCPAKDECWEKTREEAERIYPTEYRKFFRRLVTVQMEGISVDMAGPLVSHQMLQEGDPDPYTRVHMENLKRGIDDRNLLFPDT